MRPDPFTAFAAALVDPARAVPPGLIGRDHRPAGRRFAVYRNNVVVSLIDALAARFPVVAALVGAEFFRAAAGVFVRAAPPETPLLYAYGDGFADFLAGFAPAADIAYLADVARLEWAIGAAGTAADAAPLGRAALAGLSADAVAALRLDPHPSVRLVTSPWPILALWRAHQPGAAMPAIWPEGGESVLVLRDPTDRIVTVALDPGAARCLAGLLDGAAFGVAATLALAEAAPGAPCFDPGSFLLSLIDLDAVIGVTPGDPTP